jgi:hypothetical protein
LDLHWTFLGLLLLGLTLLAISSAIGLYSVSFDPSLEGKWRAPIREVGYAYAANWGLTYIFLFPLIGYILLSVLKDIPQVVGDLQRFQILRSSPNIRAADRIIEDWAVGSRLRAILVASLGIVFPAAYSAWEWTHNNLLPLLGIRRVDGLSDWDWGVKCAMAKYKKDCHPPDVFLNSAFDFVCFLVQFLYLAMLSLFVIYALDFGRILLRNRADITLMPALKLNDRRRGFGLFEPLLTKMLIVVVSAFLVAYCVRLENLYLRDSTPANTSLWKYISVYVVQGVTTGISKESPEGMLEAFEKRVSDLFDMGGDPGRQTVLVAIGLFVLLFSVASVVVGVAYGAAWRAKTNALAYYSEPDVQPLYGLSVTEELQRAETMVLWPLDYMRLNRLLLWTCVAVISLIFFRVGLVASGICIGLLLRNATKLPAKTREGPK